MPLAFIRPMGESGLYHIHVVSATDPGFGGGRPGGVDPDWGQGHPGGHPGNRPPGSGAIPDHDLPANPPPTLLPGYTLVMVRGPHGKWEYAFIAPGDAPPKPLPPGNIEHPGNRPPGSGMPPRPDNTLPGMGGPVDPGFGGGRPPVISGGPVQPRPPHVGGGPMPAPPGGTPENPIAPTPAPKA